MWQFQLCLIVGQVILCFLLGIVTLFFTRKIINPIKVLGKYVEDLKKAQDLERKQQIICDISHNEEFRHIAIQHDAATEVELAYEEDDLNQS